MKCWLLSVLVVQLIVMIVAQDVPIEEDPLNTRNKTTLVPEDLPGTWVNSPSYPESDNLYVVGQQLPCPFTSQANYPAYYQQPECPYSQNQPQPMPEQNYPLTVAPLKPVIVDADKEEVTICPIGSIQNGKMCTVPESNCPENYEWKNDKCVLIRKTCPQNFDYNGSECVQRQVCPHNHNLENGVCVAPQPTCPYNWRWNGEKCEVAQIQCQPGSIVQGNECIFESFVCPPGYKFNGSECKKPQVYCPEGYELLQNGFCSRIEIRCPKNTIIYNGQCIPTIVNCPEGSYPYNNQCYRNPTNYPAPAPPTYYPAPAPPPFYPRPVPPTNYPAPIPPTYIPAPLPPANIPQPLPNTNYPSICPAGFQYNSGRCYRCPQDYTLCNRQCVRGVSECSSYVPSSIPSNNDRHITINIIPGNKNPSPGPIAPPHKGYNIINNIEPINNTVVNINNITNPVHLNNINTNNIFVYTETECRDGSIRTTMIKNNETINGCVDMEQSNTDNKESNENEEDQNTSKKCCEIITPKQCRQRSNKWICAHKKYQYCGHFCIADKMYLKPSVPSYQHQVLTMPPPQYQVQQCMGRYCPPVDCNGCIGGSYNCSPECFSSPCEGSSGCNYLNQQDFCSTVGGQGCEE